MVKGMGFATLLWVMAGVAAVRAAVVLLLPDERDVGVVETARG
jgi:hypothetical protein